MHLRRTLAMAGSALLLTALTSCGFDAATDRPYTQAAGTNDQDADVDVLNAVIVSAEEGEGVFVAGLANNLDDEPVSFDELTAQDPNQVTVEEFDGIEIPANGYANLADEGAVPVTGEFTDGNFIELTLGFSNGDSVTMQVPVVTNCDDFEGIAGPVDEAACEPEHGEEH